MISPMLKMKMIQCLLIASLFSAFIPPIRSDPPYTNCTSTASFESQSPFHDNLQKLLITLGNNSFNSHFREASVGEGQYTVYGNFLCYNTTLECQKCVKNAAEDIKERCPSNMEAIVWEDSCQLRYSNERFSGVMNYTTYRPHLFNWVNYSNPEAFRVVVKSLLENITNLAASSPSNNNYALGEKGVGSDDTVYALVQCTSDIRSTDCGKCLHNAISEIQSCCYFYRGARVLSRSCYLR